MHYLCLCLCLLPFLITYTLSHTVTITITFYSLTHSHLPLFTQYSLLFTHLLEGQSSSIEMTTPVRRSSVIRGLLNSFNSLTTSGQYESTENNENELTLGTTSASVDDYDTSMR